MSIEVADNLLLLGVGTDHSSSSLCIVGGSGYYQSLGIPKSTLIREHLLQVHVMGPLGWLNKFGLCL